MPGAQVTAERLLQGIMQLSVVGELSTLPDASHELDKEFEWRQ
jgi:hypothetical protein